MSVEQKDQQLLEEAIAHLDFEPICEVLHAWYLSLLGANIPLASRTCGRPAEWIAVCRSCAATALECDPCHTEAKAELVICMRCQKSGRVEDVFVTSRLPGARS